MKKHHIIYKITNQINQMIYIGAHSTDDVNDSYMGSGLKLKEAQNKFGIENFKKEILFQYNNPYDMYKKEWELVNMEFIHHDNTYNTVLGGQCIITHHDHNTGYVYVYDENNQKKKIRKDSYEWQYGIYESCSRKKHRMKCKKTGKMIEYYPNKDYYIKVNNNKFNKTIKRSELLTYKEMGYIRGENLSLSYKNDRGIKKGTKKMISPENQVVYVKKESIENRLSEGWRFYNKNG